MGPLDLSDYSLQPQLIEGHIYKHYVLFWLPDNQAKLILWSGPTPSPVLPNPIWIPISWDKQTTLALAER